MAARQLSITVPQELADRAQTMVAAGEAGSLSEYLSEALAHRLDADERRMRSHALVDSVFGSPPTRSPTRPLTVSSPSSTPSVVLR